MYDNIVVGTDGSEPAWSAVSHAATLAKLASATLHVVRGVPRPAIIDAGLGGGTVAVPVMTGAIEECRAELVAQCTRIDHDDVQIHVVEAGGPDAILDVADHVSADLLVVGSRGMTGAKRFLLGSVPNAVAHHASCSVLIVKTD